MSKHIVVGRYYIYEPFDYAYIKKYTLGGCIGGNPPAIQPSWYHGTDSILFIPYTSVVATSIAS